MLKRLLLCFIIVPLFGVSYPDLDSSDVSEILQQMMSTHVSCKNITPELISRALEQFAEELDPGKTYFLKSQLTSLTHPSPEKLDQIITSISEDKDYSYFFKIHTAMLEAIERRGRLERRIERRPPSDVTKVDLSELRDLDWATDEEELFARLTKLYALQSEAVSRLEKSNKDRALARINKKRLHRESEIKGDSDDARMRFLYCHILKAFASSFDTHTCYFTPAEAAQFLIQVQQRLFGIGAQLRDDLTGFTVVKMIEGGPAIKETGLKNGDRIIAIDGEPVVGYEITDAVELIRGEAGTVVNLTVTRDVGDNEEKHEIPITRGEVVIQESRIESSTLPYGDGVIALIALHAFYQDPIHSSGADLYEEITKIRKEHKVNGIIIDLRDNTGGVLPQAITVTGLFITKGIVASIKDNLGHIEHLREIDGKMAFDGPLIILTSKASASAAEIVAQTLQDYGRAIIVGDENTFGKGTFQTFSLDASTNAKINPKGELKVTRGCYYTVSGKSPQLVGVKPDIVVPGILSNIDVGEQHNKYPLSNDSIKENYLDDLADIPPVQRDQISWLYRFNLQTKLKMYNRFIPILQENSSKRILNDKIYQDFLADIKSENSEDEKIALYLKADPQLLETINIIKDLIVLLN